jgi:hypothetical protein
MPAEPRSHVSVAPAARAPSAASCQPDGSEAPARPGRSLVFGRIGRDRTNQPRGGASRSVGERERREHGSGRGSDGPPGGAGGRRGGRYADPNRACLYLWLRGLQS